MSLVNKKIEKKLKIKKKLKNQKIKKKLKLASPDYAFSTVMSALQAATTSISVEIYQIENGSFCDFLIDQHKSGINVSVLVSSEIFSKTDYELAKKCYTSMYYAGLVGNLVF